MPTKQRLPSGIGVGSPTEQREYRLKRLIELATVKGLKTNDEIKTLVINEYGILLKWRTIKEYASIIEWKVNHIEL